MDATSIAQLVTSGTTLAALGAAVWQVRSNRHQARDATTHSYIARMTGAEFTKHLARSMDELRVDDPTDLAAAAAWRRFTRMKHAQRLDVATPFNAFESIAGLYNRNQLNRRIVEQQLEHTATVVYERIAWWVARVQAEDRDYFREWERMLGWFAERRLRTAWHTSRP
jgi:hypothetical protein